MRIETNPYAIIPSQDAEPGWWLVQIGGLHGSEQHYIDERLIDCAYRRISKHATAREAADALRDLLAFDYLVDAGDVVSWPREGDHLVYRLPESITLKNGERLRVSYTDHGGELRMNYDIGSPTTEGAVSFGMTIAEYRILRPEREAKASAFLRKIIG